ncbi:hypothetical protein [Nocardioides stalactiti]|uniref:hypothetical protein n=1 Tax=Nocardioides stalactiti TaxID=2755356 RepID=UPI0015FF5F10|nr:hypothetical protein [Nocardioides stalactiti]
MPVRLDPRGVTGPTRGEARGKRWRRSSHGFYLPADVDSSHPEQRIVEASVVVPTGGAITGWGALRWQGATWLSGTNSSGQVLPVPILISTHDIRPQPGLLLSGEGCAADLISRVDGVAVTHPAWSTAFVMRYARTLEEAVVAFEMAAFADLVSYDEIAALVAEQAGWYGVPRARNALPFCGENSWSPMESVMKVLWMQHGGFRMPLQNRPVFDLAGRLIGTPDLFDPIAGVAAEYNGAHHLQRDQYVADVNRAAIFRDHHIEVVERSAGDRREDFVQRLAAAYRRAGRRRTSRTWTIDAPSWWTPTVTVSQRRSLSPADRERLLKNRMR